MLPSRVRRLVLGDVRFLIGIVLVVASVAGVWMLVSSSRATRPVLQATHTIVVGETVDSSDFRVLELGLGVLTDAYLSPQGLTPGAVARRTLPRGELVPVDAVGDGADVRTTTIVVTSGAVPAGVGAGTRVEIWHAPLLDDGRTFDRPRVLVADAVVSAVAEAEGMLTGDTAELEVVIDRGDVADMLSAITGGSAISVVPAGRGS